MFDEIGKSLSERYGVDFAKVNRMSKAGELTSEDLTNELLLSPEFAYMPYPGFKPTPVPAEDFQ